MTLRRGALILLIFATLLSLVAAVPWSIKHGACPPIPTTTTFWPYPKLTYYSQTNGAQYNVKRATESIQAVLNENCRGPLLGYGQNGNVYALEKPFGGASAVLKVVELPEPGRPGMTLEQLQTEATNLAHVNQLLAWGTKATTRGKKTHTVVYFVMKNMGISPSEAEKQGLTMPEAYKLIEEAKTRYKTHFKMEQRYAIDS